MWKSLDGHKIQKIKSPYKISVSHTHTHTHMHTYSLTHSETYCRSVYRKSGLKNKLLRTLKTILFAFTVAIVWKKNLKTTPKKMANIKNLTMGEIRLLFIHTECNIFV